MDIRKWHTVITIHHRDQMNLLGWGAVSYSQLPSGNQRSTYAFTDVQHPLTFLLPLSIKLVTVKFEIFCIIEIFEEDSSDSNFTEVHRELFREISVQISTLYQTQNIL